MLSDNSDLFLCSDWRTLQLIAKSIFELYLYNCYQGRDRLLASKTKRNSFYLRKTGSPEFREALCQEWQWFGQEQYQSESRFLLHYLFGQRDQITRLVPCSQKIIAYLTTGNPKNTNVRAKEFLLNFQQLASGFQFSGYTHHSKTWNHCRLGWGLTPSEQFEQLYFQELKRCPQQISPRVYLITGKKYYDAPSQRQPHQREDRQRELTIIEQVGQQREDFIRNSAQRKILAYLHNQPNYLPQMLKKYGSELWDFSFTLPISKQESVQRTLTWLMENPDVPTRYGAGENTLRLNPLGISVVQLPRQMRKHLMQGNLEGDLCACQLALMAVIWDVPRLKWRLESEENIWHYLTGEIGLPKSLLKLLIYGFSYGAAYYLKRTPYHDGDGLLGIVESWLEEHQLPIVTEEVTKILKTFRSSRLIKELVKARRKHINQLKQNQGFIDPYGTHWSMTIDSQGKSDAYKLLSIEMQAWEFWLMESVYDVLIRWSKERPAEVITLIHQHDGLTLKLARKRSKQDLIKEIEISLTNRTLACPQLGLKSPIPTKFEVEWLKPQITKIK
jgi:hypothetical protein